MFHKKTFLLAILITLLAFALRLPGLGSFMTADEENWMIRSGEFWNNLFLNNDPGGTFRTSHPGVITMWLAGGGIFIQEQRLGYRVDESNLVDFRKSAVFPIALSASLLVGLTSFFFMRLFGFSAGIFAGVLLATDPYLVGMSQVVHLDTLLGLLMINAFLCFLSYWRAGRKNSLLLLVITGVLTGLALLNKLLPALWLFVMYGMVMLFHTQDFWWTRIQKGFRTGMFIFGSAALIFFICWPALLVMKNTVEYFQRDTVTIITDEHTANEASEEPIAPRTFYLRTLLGRTTPFVLIVNIGVLIITSYQAVRSRRISRPLWLILYGLGFLVLITAVAKKGDRYAVPALIAFLVTAGWGMGVAWQIILGRVRLLKHRIVAGAAVASLLFLLVVQSISWSPYAIAYNNPLFDNIRPMPQQGWGEGLDEAARWLNAHPFADRLMIASWYPGVMGTYFNGRTFSLSSREDHRVGFVVTYRNMEGRAEDDTASNVLDEFIDKKPEHIVYIQGKPYVWIYNTLGPRYFRQHIGELVQGVEVGQIVPIEEENWDRIDIAIATFSSRNNTEDVLLHVREGIESEETIRTVRVNASEMKDEEWQTFSFEPIRDSAGKTFYVSIESPTSYKGNAVTVRYVKEDVLPGQLVLRTGPLKEGETMRDYLRDGDIGYRLP